MPLPDARTAVHEHLSGSLPGATLFRCLVEHNDWHIPARTGEDGEPTLVNFIDESGGRWLKLFTDAAAVELWFEKEGGAVADQCLVTAGYSIFGVLEDELAGIEINPQSAEAIHYVTEHIPVLKHWARAVRIEQALSTVDIEDTPLGLLKDYDAYVLVLRKTGDESAQLVLAPDEQGRSLAAVFTAEDSLEAFFETVLADADFEPVPVRVGGEQLFAQLNALPLDGIVFNCSGPGQPRAFGKRLAEYVLSSTQEQSN